MNTADSSIFNRSVLEQINRRVREVPDRIAIRTPCEYVSYRQIDDLSRKIAGELTLFGEIEQQPLAVLSSDPAILAGALLACLRSGAIYAPIDPGQPAARAHQIARNLDAAALITDSAQVALVQGMSDLDVPVAVIDHREPGQPKPVSQTHLTTSRLLWIMHTSGSMGRPKGVVQTEVNVSRYVWQVTNGFNLMAPDGLCLAASLCSHAGAVMCLSALCSAATFCTLDFRKTSLEDVSNFLAAYDVSVLFTIPGILSALDGLGAMKDRRFPALRLVRLSGETVTRADIENCWSMFPDLELVSVGYGTTETGGISQHFFRRRDAIPDDPIPVGREIPGTEVRIACEHGGPAKPGEDGEIVVVSRFLSPGYWKDPASTQAAFRQLDDGSTLYSTGDWGQLKTDGILVHKGRRDLQFKRMGMRIESREIELALARIPTIMDAVVRPRPGPKGVSIVAYLVAKDGSINKSRIKRQLLEILPMYMVPDHLVQLDSIPRTPAGKVAYNDLPEPTPVIYRN